MARIASKLRSLAPALLLLVLPLLIGGASLGLILRGQQSPTQALSDSLVEELLNQQISSAAMAAGEQPSAERLAVPPAAVQPELAIRVMLHNGPGLVSIRRGERTEPHEPEAPAPCVVEFYERRDVLEDRRVVADRPGGLLSVRLHLKNPES